MIFAEDGSEHTIDVKALTTQQILEKIMAKSGGNSVFS